jgi:hypothetical protein
MMPASIEPCRRVAYVVLPVAALLFGTLASWAKKERVGVPAPHIFKGGK